MFFPRHENSNQKQNNDYEPSVNKRHVLVDHSWQNQSNQSKNTLRVRAESFDRFQILFRGMFEKQVKASVTDRYTGSRISKYC